LHEGSLGAGLQIRVTPGEELRLSSTASLEGTGSLNLELVARDAVGNVVDWGFAAERVAAGPKMPVATDFVVPGNLATLEPRWSGSEPALVRVEGFLLERRSKASGSGASASVWQGSHN
jgi:hypothetical protein